MPRFHQRQTMLLRAASAPGATAPYIGRDVKKCRSANAEGRSLATKRRSDEATQGETEDGGWRMAEMQKSECRMQKGKRGSRMEDGGDGGQKRRKAEGRVQNEGCKQLGRSRFTSSRFTWRS